MERLLVVRLAVEGCTAEAWLNGLPMARATPHAPHAVVPAHEAALAGANRIELVVGPGRGAKQAAALLQTAPHPMAARVQVLLPRIDRPIDAAESRTLAALDWAAAQGEPLELPVRRSQTVDLPLGFPRWRWLDAPVVQPTAALQQQAHAFVAGLARDLARGQTESFLAATRLRTEELAIAYQRSPESERERLREWLEELHAASRLAWQPLAPADLQLRPLADGRLLEAVGPDDRAALATAPDKEGRTLSLPLRLSIVEGRFYVLR